MSLESGRWWQRPGELVLSGRLARLFDLHPGDSVHIGALPAGSEGEVARRYLAFRELLAPLGLEPRQVLLSSRLAWQLRLSNGLTVQLGRDSDKDGVEERLARFVSVYPALARSRHRLDYVDLRYPNGFALRISETPRAEPLGPSHKRV